MSLRFRLFTMLGGLILLLLLAQWWWVSRLMRELDVEVGEMALEVGSSVIEAFDPNTFITDDVLPDDVFTERPARETRTEETICVGDEPCKDVVITTVDSVSGDRNENIETVMRRVRAVRQGESSGDPTVTYAFDLRADSDCPPGDTNCQPQQRTAFWWRGSGNGDVVARHLVLRSRLDDDSTLIPIPDAGVKERVGHFSQQLLFGTGALFLVGLLAVALVAQRVSAPLRQLSAAAERVGDGDLGTRVGADSSDQDVGRALRAFDRMSTRLAELDNTNRALAARQHLGEIGEIARGLAHTLRNPLNALGLSLEELAVKAPPGDDVDHHAQAARRQIRRIDSSIRSFLALASQGGAAEDEAVDLGALVQDVALEALQDAGGRVGMAVHPADDLPSLRAVGAELRAVVQALVVNAVEASPDGATVTVEIAGDSADEGGAKLVRLVVDDRGAGLDPQIRARLFMPHQTTKAHGSGMGLFLAHRIATTRYGGSLALADRDGGGTRATLVLGDRREGSAA